MLQAQKKDKHVLQDRNVPSKDFQRSISNPKYRLLLEQLSQLRCGSQGPISRRGGQPAMYLSVSCHDQRSGSSGLRFATRHGQGGG